MRFHTSSTVAIRAFLSIHRLTPVLVALFSAFDTDFQDKHFRPSGKTEDSTWTVSVEYDHTSTNGTWEMVWCKAMPILRAQFGEDPDAALTWNEMFCAGIRQAVLNRLGSDPLGDSLEAEIAAVQAEVMEAQYEEIASVDLLCRIARLMDDGHKLSSWSIEAIQLDGVKADMSNVVATATATLGLGLQSVRQTLANVSRCVENRQLESSGVYLAGLVEDVIRGIKSPDLANEVRMATAKALAGEDVTGQALENQQ